MSDSLNVKISEYKDISIDSRYNDNNNNNSNSFISNSLIIEINNLFNSKIH